MSIKTSKFKTADLDLRQLEDVIENLSLEDAYGYVLIDDYLVPYAFIERLYDHVNNYTFSNYEAVLPIEDILGDGFWESLDEDERRVAGSCLLMVIEDGYVPAIPENRHQFKVESTL